MFIQNMHKMERINFSFTANTIMLKPNVNEFIDKFLKYLPLMVLSIIPITFIAILMPFIVFLPFLPLLVLLIPLAPLMMFSLPFLPEAHLLELSATTAALEGATLNLMGITLGVVAMALICTLACPMLRSYLNDRKQLKEPDTKEKPMTEELANSLSLTKTLTPFLNYQRERLDLFHSVSALPPLTPSKMLKK